MPVNCPSLSRSIARSILPLAVCGALALSLGACATPTGEPALASESGDDAARSRELQQLAQSVMTDSGHVSVKVDGDVCFVYGFVESAIDEKQILRTLESADGIATVRNGLQREM